MHRLVQSKGDGKPVQWERGDGQPECDEKFDALTLEVREEGSKGGRGGRSQRGMREEEEEEAREGVGDRERERRREEEREVTDNQNVMKSLMPSL